MKHTPAPWKFYTSPQPNGCPIVGTYNGLMVAMLAHSINEKDQKETAIANARLIAAAPELLEALEMAIQIGDQCSRGFLAEFHAKAKAAIAKAKGES